MKVLVDFDPESGPQVLWRPDEYEREAEHEFPTWYQRAPFWRCLVYHIPHWLSLKAAKLLYPYHHS